MKKHKINANKKLDNSTFMNNLTNVCYTRHVGYMIYDFPASILLDTHVHVLSARLQNNCKLKQN